MKEYLYIIFVCLLLFEFGIYGIFWFGFGWRFSRNIHFFLRKIAWKTYTFSPVVLRGEKVYVFCGQNPDFMRACGIFLCRVCIYVYTASSPKLTRQNFFVWLHQAHTTHKTANGNIHIFAKETPLTKRIPALFSWWNIGKHGIQNRWVVFFVKKSRGFHEDCHGNPCLCYRNRTPAKRLIDWWDCLAPCWCPLLFRQFPAQYPWCRTFSFLAPKFVGQGW